MAKLSIFDIVALAKAGFKAADIKELTELEVSEEAAPENDGEASQPAESEPLPTTESEPKEVLQVKSGDQTGADDIDYKSLYEAKCKELETAQQSNVKQNQPNQSVKTPTDVINEMMRDFM